MDGATSGGQVVANVKTLQNMEELNLKRQHNNCVMEAYVSRIGHLSESVAAPALFRV